MDSVLRDKFDGILEEVLGQLPEHAQRLLEEVPLIAEDEPGPEVLEKMGVKGGAVLCGLYTGIPLMRRSVRHSGTLPDRINIYRRGIMEVARNRGGKSGEEDLKRQIRLTVLHEIGHHFGMGEGDLRELGHS